MPKETFNIFHGDTDAVPPGAPGDRGRAARVGSKIGGERLGMSVYDLPAGEAIGPYHVELTDEEWLIVVHGEVTVRTPDGERTLTAGDVLCFPVGPDGAHVVRNGSNDEARVALISTKNEFCIVEYPEDGKLQLWAGDAHYMLDHPTATTDA
ncbi:MAG TPA: cupin domain-containing protein [Gaiellaceae bacterium]